MQTQIRYGVLTSLQRVLGTFSTSCTGSWNVTLPSDTSGIHIAHSKCAHFIVVVCLKAPSPFGQNMQPWVESVRPATIVRKKTYRKLTCRSASTDQLAPSAEPLSFWDEGHTVALLMNGQVTAIAEYYGVGVLAVAIIADCAFCILFLPLACRLPVHCSRATRSWPMCLRWLRVWFWDALKDRQ